MRASALGLPLCALALALGCGGGGPAMPGDAGPEDTPDTSPPTHPLLQGVTWFPCMRSVANGELDADCAQIPLPLDWDDPDGQRIDVFVKRLPAVGPPEGQLWLFHGEPGLSGATMEIGAAQIQRALPQVEVISVDHRGAGRSTRLACFGRPLPPYWSARLETENVHAIEQVCQETIAATWGDDVRNFGTYQSSRDVLALLEAFSLEGVPRHAFALQHGTPWLLRVLARDPDAFASVTFDSPCAPGRCGYLHLAAETERVLHRGLDLCAATPDCAARLGDDPWTFAQETLAALEAGSCPGVTEGPWPVERLRLALGALAVTHRGNLREVAPLLYRAARCEPRDVAALQRYWDIWELWTPQGLEPESLSWLALVQRNEGSPRPLPSLEDVAATTAAAPISDRSELMYHALLSAAPTYEDPAWEIPRIEAPVLVLRGGYDAFSSAADVDAIRAANPHLVDATVPNASRIVLMNSPTGDIVGCGAALFLAFLDNPEAPLDTGCVDRVLPPPLDFPRDRAVYDFLSEDAWD